MKNLKFEHWLGELLGQNEGDVRRLLQDSAALHFLIAWSLLESKCFSGFATLDKLEAFAAELVPEPDSQSPATGQSYDCSAISDVISHFHARYQNKRRYRQLMHPSKAGKDARGRAGKAVRRLNAIVLAKFDSLASQDRVFMVMFVVYRFRNNMFHGNKGVQSWLQYKEQILCCTEAMQSFVSYCEKRNPSLQQQDVA